MSTDDRGTNSNMKSLLAIFASAVFVMGLAACGESSTRVNTSAGTFQSEQVKEQIDESKSSLKEVTKEETEAETKEDSAEEKGGFALPGLMVLGANRQDEEIKAYAEFLSDYMDHPAVSTLYKDDFGETDEPVDKSCVYFELIYLDDDDTCELALANGDCPWHPIHVFSYSDGKVEQGGEYSMYGQMYYSPKKSYVLPMYYLPAMETDIDIYGTDKTITFKPGVDENAFLRLFDNNVALLSEVKDLEAELTRMKEVAPIGITPIGAPITDDSYLKEGKSKIEGEYGEELPGIWYRFTEESDLPTWIEVDTNGTFTAHAFDGYVEATGYINYYGDSPILKNGYIYNFKNSDGTEYMDFEMAPVKDYGYMLDYCGIIYYKNPEKWDVIGASPDEDIWYVACKNDHTVKVRCQLRSDASGDTYFKEYVR
jgi:hypothetical protein